MLCQNEGTEITYSYIFPLPICTNIGSCEHARRFCSLPKCCNYSLCFQRRHWLSLEVYQYLACLLPSGPWSQCLSTGFRIIINSQVQRFWTWHHENLLTYSMPTDSTKGLSSRFSLSTRQPMTCISWALSQNLTEVITNVFWLLPSYQTDSSRCIMLI